MEPNMVSISSGYKHLCQVNRDLKLNCWGQNIDAIKIPKNHIGLITSGQGHTCLVIIGNKILCFGLDNFGQVSSVCQDEFINYIFADAGWQNTCTIQLNSRITCIGSNKYGQSKLPDAQMKTYLVETVSSGYDHTCALANNRNDVKIFSYSKLTCWGGNLYGQSEVDQMDLTQSQFQVGLTESEINYSKEITQLRRNEVQSRVRSVKCGTYFTCIIIQSGHIICYGVNDKNQISNPISNKYESLSTMNDYSCAIDNKRNIECWGQRAEELMRVPTRLTELGYAVSSGGYFSCAIDKHWDLHCWGVLPEYNIQTDNTFEIVNHM